MASHTVGGRTPRERGLAYGLAGGAAVTLISILVGGGLFAWLLFAARGPAAPELLPADVQLYAATSPNVGGVVEVEQLRRALREGIGVADPAALLAPVERQLGVALEGNVGTWLGSEIAVAVRGFDPTGAGGAAAADELLREGEVLFFFGSKNDPQAAAFLEKVRAAQEAAGARVTATTPDEETTLYAVEGGPPSPVAAYGLVQHYVVFSNSPAALAALADAGGGLPNSLVGAPGFAEFREGLGRRQTGAVYTDGSPAAEAVRAALRELLEGL